MLAPPPKPVVLAVDRTRCSCGVETLVFAPKPWYEHQGTVSIEPACVGCNKSLLEQTVPEGAKWESYALEQAPADLARAIGTELSDEVIEAREEPVEDPPGGLTPERWSSEHEAPAAYEAWLASRPRAPGPISRAEMIAWGTASAVVALYVAFCVVV